MLNLEMEFFENEIDILKFHRRFICRIKNLKNNLDVELFQSKLCNEPILKNYNVFLDEKENIVIIAEYICETCEEVESDFLLFQNRVKKFAINNLKERNNFFSIILKLLKKMLQLCNKLLV